MNRYSAWKYLLLVALTVVALIYAMPNLYGEHPAVQISLDSDIIDSEWVSEVENILAENDIEPIDIEVGQTQLLMRLQTNDAQLKAKDVLSEALGTDATIALNLAPATPSWLRRFNANPMYLGLDLRGGIHFLMQIDMDGVIKNVLEGYATEIRTELREQKIRNRGTRIVDNQISIRFDHLQARDKAYGLLAENYPALELQRADQNGDYSILAEMSSDTLVEEKRNALVQNMAALRNRVNALGVSEPVIQQQGLDRIVVQLPGVQDSAKAREIIGSTATLEYRLQYGTYSDGLDAEQSGRVPSGAKLYRHREGFPVLLQRSRIVTGDNIQNAAVTYDENGQPAVRVTLDAAGASRMLKVTKKNVKKPMAVVFQETKFETEEVAGELVRKARQVETVISLATIKEALSKQFITTGLTQQEASRLAILLRAGALKAPMEIIEERTIGPSLGADNIAKGMQSVLIGLFAVLVFMLCYYRNFGLVANVALLVNLTLIIALMSLLQATLTLPGIAGIVLTVGMAVDANVLIFERIKEEMALGSKVQEAIYQGYDKAFSTIFDANITTLIAATLLFVFGTGPVKGFAVTLCIGILTSMLTAIVGTRALVNLMYGGKRLRSLPIAWRSVAKKFQYNFMQKKTIAIALSLSLMVVSIGSLVSRGLNLGIDFTGGYLIEVGYSDSVELGTVRDTLAIGGFEDAVVQHFGTSKDIIIRVQPDDSVQVSALSEQMMSLLTVADLKPTLRRVEFVGPQVGEELREDGGMAMLFALLAIVVYVALRFQLKFSIGAVIALVHDVLITMGIFSLTQIEFDLTVLAALLAVIGYSLNDTIVVFDRIRENFGKMRRSEPVAILNTSINQTLSRTMMTSLTTLLVLVALFLLGGEVIHAFAFALIVGVIVGTYSSIFIASTGLLLMRIKKEDLLEPARKNEELDAIP